MLDLASLRRGFFEENKKHFATAPIRLFSKTDEDAKKAAHAAGQTYDGYSGAIGDINLESFPKEIQESIYHTRRAELLDAGERLVKAERPVYTSYEYSATGYDCLKRLWTEKYLALSPETAKLTPFICYGGTNAFFVASKAVARAVHVKLKHQPKALVAAPTFPPFVFQLRQSFDVTLLPAKAEDHFLLTSEALAAAAGDYDLLYLIVVSNPTAIPYSPEQLRSLLRTALTSHPRAIVFLDAVYLRTLPTAQAKALWEVCVAPEFQDHVVIIESLSKTYGRTGLRSGVAFVANHDVQRELRNIMQNELAGCSYAMQIESCGLLSLVDEDAVQALAAHSAGRRKRFLARFLDKYQDCFVPLAEQPILLNGGDWQGGLYAFLQLRDGVDPTEFFLETGIAGVPGASFFGGDIAMNKYVRVSFGMEDL